MTRRSVRIGIAILAATALTVSACSSSGGSETSSSTTSSTQSSSTSESATSTPDAASSETTAESTESAEPTEEPANYAEGCENGWTDPADLSPTRQPARCEANFPAPQPLAERTKIVVTSATLKGEYLAHLRYAIDKGEFEKENLEVELTQVPPADSINLLATGDSDVAFGAPDGAFVNATAAGVPVKWVLGNFFPRAESETGLWIRDVDGRPGQLTDLGGEENKLGTAIGPGSVSMYPIVSAFREAGVDFDDIVFQITPVADLATAFENGAVTGAYLTDPYWTQFVDKTGYTFAAGQPAAEPLGGTLFGPNLLEKNPEAGVAFVRALVRTVSTYFAGDYKADPAFAQVVADTIELPLDLVQQTPSLNFDWEIRGGTVERLEDAYHTTGAVEKDINLTDDQLVDRSFYERAVGHVN